MLRLLCLSIMLLWSTRASALGPVDLKPLQTDNIAGCARGATGTATYVFNQAITGTTSAAIDLGNFGCFFFTVTTTGGGQPIRIWTSSNSTSYTSGTTVTAGSLYGFATPAGPNQQANYTMTKVARYVWFDIPGMSPAIGGPNYVTPPASKYSLWYYVPTDGTTSNPIVSGTVTANQGSAGTVAWPMYLTQTTGPNDALTYGYLTTTAAGTAGRGGSYTAVALTNAYSMNMTFAAGVNAPGVCTIYPSVGLGSAGGSGFFWNSMPAWLAPTSLLAVSTTPLMFTYGIGDFLNMSVTAAALSVTPQVRYAPIY